MGHVIGKGVIRTHPEKLEAMAVFRLASNLKDLRRFLGMVGWYRKCFHNFAMVTVPLTNLLKPRQKFVMTPEGKEAFESLKKLVCSAPELRSPDFGKPFWVQCVRGIFLP